MRLDGPECRLLAMTLNEARPLLRRVLLFSAVTILAVFALRRSFDRPPHAGIQLASPPDIQQFWGAYTPYFPAKPYIPPPSHCQITQVRWSLFCLVHHVDL